jgi:hypothetical protein
MRETAKAVVRIRGFIEAPRIQETIGRGSVGERPGSIRLAYNSVMCLLPMRAAIADNIGNNLPVGVVAGSVASNNHLPQAMSGPSAAGGAFDCSFAQPSRSHTDQARTCAGEPGQRSLRAHRTARHGPLRRNRGGVPGGRILALASGNRRPE